MTILLHIYKHVVTSQSTDYNIFVLIA